MVPRKQAPKCCILNIRDGAQLPPQLRLALPNSWAWKSLFDVRFDVKSWNHRLVCVGTDA